MVKPSEEAGVTETGPVAIPVGCLVILAGDKGVDGVAYVLAGDLLEQGIAQRAGKADHAAVKPVTRDLFRHPDLVARQMPVERRDHGDMLQWVDDVEEVSERESFRLRLCRRRRGPLRDGIDAVDGEVGSGHGCFHARSLPDRRARISGVLRVRPAIFAA
jgi:hypothetical protein